MTECDILYKKDGFIFRYQLVEGYSIENTSRTYKVYCYRIYVPKETLQIMAAWWEENGIDAAKGYNDRPVRRNGKCYSGPSINFQSKEDAMAFKLYWN